MEATPSNFTWLLLKSVCYDKLVLFFFWYRSWRKDQGPWYHVWVETAVISSGARCCCGGAAAAWRLLIGLTVQVFWRPHFLTCSPWSIFPPPWNIMGGCFSKPKPGENCFSKHLSSHYSVLPPWWVLRLNWVRHVEGPLCRESSVENFNSFSFWHSGIKAIG